jgi:hypothetical protein
MAVLRALGVKTRHWLYSTLDYYYCQFKGNYADRHVPSTVAMCPRSIQHCLILGEVHSFANFFLGFKVHLQLQLTASSHQWGRFKTANSHPWAAKN